MILAVEQGSSARTVNEFVASNYPFVFLLDERYSTGVLYGAEALPTTYFLDPEGVIQKVFVGMMEEDDIESGLRAIGLK